MADEIFYDCTRGPPGQSQVATDESYFEFLGKEAGTGFQVDDGQAPRLLVPLSGASISASAAPAFSFDGRIAASGGDRHRSPWAVLRSALSWEGTAFAHCPAVNGENFLFRLTVPGRATPVYTALLSVTRFSPDPTRWTRALAGLVGRRVSLTLARAVFARGMITNGPFVAAAAPWFEVRP
jgi:hypothetical protein